MALEKALLCAWRIAGAQSAAIEPAELTKSLPGGALWVHLVREPEHVRNWLGEVASVPAHVVAALLAEDTRPRCEVFSEGILLNLRGMDLNPNAEPDELLSLRMWITPKLIISLRRKPLMAVQALRQRLREGRGPDKLGQLLAMVASGLTERIDARVMSLGGELDRLETDMTAADRHTADRVSLLRWRIVKLRRFAGPQAQALQGLLGAGPEMLTLQDRAFLQNTGDTVYRLQEDLDELRDRSNILKDDVVNAVNQRMSRHMYIFTVLAGIFLPLTFVTGLLGINVGGIPGSESPTAFLMVCALLSLLVLVEVLLLRRLHLIR